MAFERHHRICFGILTFRIINQTMSRLILHWNPSPYLCWNCVQIHRINFSLVSLPNNITHVNSSLYLILISKNEAKTTNQAGSVVVFSSTLWVLFCRICQQQQFSETHTKSWKGPERSEGGDRRQKSEAKPLYLTKFYLIWFYYSLTSRYYDSTHCTDICICTTHGGDHTGPPYDRWYFASLSPHSSFIVVVAAAAALVVVAAQKYHTHQVHTGFYQTKRSNERTNEKKEEATNGSYQLKWFIYKHIFWEPALLNTVW